MGGACPFTTPHCSPVLLHPLLYSQHPHHPLHPRPLLSLAWPLPPPPPHSRGSLSRSCARTLPNPTVSTYAAPHHLRLVHSPAAAWVQDSPSPVFPSLSVSHPPSFLVLAALSLSFSQIPCLPPAAASSAPRPPETLGQSPFPGVPESSPAQLTTPQGHCRSGLHLSHQAGKSRRRVPEGGEHPAASAKPGTQKALNKCLLGQ